MKNKLTMMAAFIGMLLLTVSCGETTIDKSQYEPVAFDDAGFGTIIGTSEPNANETKLYTTQAQYHELPDGVREAFGLGKKQIALADPASNVITPFDVKGKIPELKDGQLVRIYFRMERKGGKVEKVVIDLIE